MLCQKCGQQGATYFVQLHVNGRASRYALCDGCLAEVSAGAAGDAGTPSGTGAPRSAGPHGGVDTAAPAAGGVDRFGRDLTDLARSGRLDPVIGRSTEVERLVQILLRRTKNNPVLIGEPGVGKTAIVEGLAQRIVDHSVPEPLWNKRVVALDLAALVAGTRYRGEFEERMTGLLDAVRQHPDTIVFIDELHTVVGAGGVEGGMDAGNILKPALARGELQCIGATTIAEYRRYIESDAALERRFQPVTVAEPTAEQALAMLEGLRPALEEHHRVRYTPDAVAAAVRLAHRHLTDRFLPDSAIDLLDEAGARAAIQAAPVVPERLAEVRQDKAAAIAAEDYEAAARLRAEEAELVEQARAQTSGPVPVTAAAVEAIVSAWTGIPAATLSQDEGQRLLQLEDELHREVVGQQHAVAAVARAIRRARAGLKDPQRPIGSFLFVGPTGTGKTQLARTLARALFGAEEAMIRFDMSEFMERHSVSRLVGAPPGYVGHDEPGELTEAVRRRPYAVILLDEIEKAHGDVFNLLLQVLEDGRLTDGHGKTVDFRNAVIIMTSNLGVELGRPRRPLGFVDRDAAEAKSDLVQAVKAALRPEFINRLDEIIEFRPLGTAELLAIAELELAKVSERLVEQEIGLEVTRPAKAHLVEKGTDPVYGARPLRRVIDHELETLLAEAILSGRLQSGDTARVSVQEGHLVLQ